jgi:hypothetical protein
MGSSLALFVYICKNYFSHLLNVYRIAVVRQREVHTAEPLVPGPSPSEVEIAIAKFTKNKLTGTDKIATELIQAGGETLHSEILKLLNCIWNKKYKSSDIDQSPEELIQAGD